MRWITVWTAGIAVWMIGLSVHAQSGGRLDNGELAARVNGELAARVNGEPVYTFSVETMLKLKRQKEPNISRAKVLEVIVTDRLLASAARRKFKEDELHPSKRVAFTRDVALDDQLVASLRTVYGQQIEATLATLPGKTLNALITEQTRLDPVVLNPVFGTSGKLLLEYTLEPAQLEAAKGIRLLHYSLPDGPSGMITLYDVYRRQNVQGRVELYNRNLDFLQQQAKLNLAGIFVLHWARQKFGTPAVDDLRRTLSDQDEVQTLMQLHGIGDDIEEQSALLNRLAKETNPDEIAAYYRAHKDEFKRIERVKARHIRVADEKLANEITAAASKGEDFAALAQRHSRAEDGKSGGDLGWIVHKGKLDWLAQLAFIQPVGKVSRPFRTPAGPTEAAFWEIVLVERQVQGYQAADSEEVRYIASGAIAREKAISQFKAMRENSLRSAKIETYRKTLDETLQQEGNKS